MTFADVTNPGDVPLLIPHPEGLEGAGATVVAREVSAPIDWQRSRAERFREYSSG